MNAIVGLCHFCENHGPSTLFCTQVFHSQNTAHSDTERQSLENVTLKDKSPSNRDPLMNSLPAVSNDSDCETMKCDKASSLPPVPTQVEPQCDSCRPFPIALQGYVSTDPETRMRYISNQNPSDPQVFSMVRQACVRSLSSEVSPGRDGPGPIFYGDDSSGYVLSHTFILKDSQYSRGFQRRYSIIVVMMDKIYLLNSWPFLVKHFKDIISEIQAKAIKVYETEQSKSPNKAHKMTHSGAHFLHSGRTAIAPGKPARSLVDLTGDKQIFRKLHQTFTWLLKAGGNRLTEKLLEGPPTEDSIIDVENQEETEEGFVLLESKKDIKEEQVVEGFVPSEDEDQDEDCPTFKNLRNVLKVIGYSQFHKLAYHVVIGNQIIIQGTKRKLIKSIIDCLKVLLPKGCCRVIYYSGQYEDSWRCNFLGLPLSVYLPQHVERYAIMNIYEAPETHTEGEAEDAVLALIGGGEFAAYTFTIESPTLLPEKGPVVLNKMEYALLNDNLADSVVDQCLVCLKEEWMNKVKVLFKFTKAGGSRSEEDTRELLRIVGANENDKIVLKFWMTGLSVQYRNHMLSSAIDQTVSK